MKKPGDLFPGFFYYFPMLKRTKAYESAVSSINFAVFDEPCPLFVSIRIMIGLDEVFFSCKVAAYLKE